MKMTSSDFMEFIQLAIRDRLKAEIAIAAEEEIASACERVTERIRKSMDAVVLDVSTMYDFSRHGNDIVIRVIKPKDGV